MGSQGIELELTMQAAQPHTPNLPSFSSSKKEASIALCISSRFSVFTSVLCDQLSYSADETMPVHSRSHPHRQANTQLAPSSKYRPRTPRRLTQ